MTDKARRVLSAFIKSSSPEDWLCLETRCGHYCKFFTLAWIEDPFHCSWQPWHVTFSLIITLRTFTFSVKGNTLSQSLLGCFTMRALPGTVKTGQEHLFPSSMLLCPLSENCLLPSVWWAGSVETRQGMARLPAGHGSSPSWARPRQLGLSLCNLKLWFISVIFHLKCSDFSYLWVLKKTRP